ncbi:hypothetical protein [Streptomyces cremeus]
MSLVPLHRRIRLERSGLALRFALIIGDRRLADAHQVSCEHDTVTVAFPEVRVTVTLTGSATEWGVLVALRLRTSPGALPGPAPYAADRVLTGRAGGPEQREALLREILAARGPHSAGRPAARTGLTPFHVLAAAV